MEGNPAEAGTPVKEGTPVEEGIQAAGAAGSRRLAGAGRVADSRSWFSVSLCYRAMGRRVTKLLLSLPLCWVRCSARAVSTARVHSLYDHTHPITHDYARARKWHFLRAGAPVLSVDYSSNRARLQSRGSCGNYKPLRHAASLQ